MSPLDTACKIRNEAQNSMIDLARGGVVLFEKPEDLDVEADRLWNDSSVLRDFIGDKIFWASNMMKTMDDKKLCLDICTCLIHISHPAMKEAVNVFMIGNGMKDKE